MSGPDFTFAATDAFGCTSSRLSLTTLTGTPVALVKASTSFRNASSSAWMKRFQRSRDSLAFGSGLCSIESAAQALAQPSRSPETASAPNAADPFKIERRVIILFSLELERFCSLVLVKPPQGTTPEESGRCL